MNETERRLRDLREILLSRPDLREGAERLVRAILVDLSEFEDYDDSPTWLRELLDDATLADVAGLDPSTMDVGEVRRRLRWTLAELAARDLAPPDTSLGQAQRAGRAFRTLGFEIALVFVPYVRRAWRVLNLPIRFERRRP